MRTIRTFLYHPLSSSILSGILGSVSFLVPSLSLLAYIALVPLIISIKHTPSSWCVFFNGLLAGSIIAGAHVSWFWGTYPLVWAGITSPIIALCMIAMIWVLSSLALGAFTGLWALSLHHLLRLRIPVVLTGTSLWITLSFLRAVAFSLLWAGPYASVGPYWDFGSLSLPLADIPYILSLTSLGGPLLLEGSVVCVALALSFLIPVTKNFLRAKTTQICVAVCLVVFFILPTIASFLLPKEKGEPVTVMALALNESSVFGTTVADAERKHAHILSVLKQATQARVQTDMLIFPEDTNFLFSLPQDGRVELLSALSKQGTIVAFDSITKRTGDGNLALSAQYYDVSGNIFASDQKRFLAPFGEYLPYIMSIPARMIGENTWVDTFADRRQYTRGTTVAIAHTQNLPTVTLAMLFCAETTPSLLYTEAVSAGATILGNAASHSSFNGHPVLRTYVIRKAKIHAVTHHRFFIHAGNMVPAFIIDAGGHMLSTTSVGDTTFLVGDVVPFSKLTFADATHIEMYILLLAFGVTALFLYQTTKRVYSHSSHT